MKRQDMAKANVSEPPLREKSSGGTGGSPPRREFSRATKRAAWERANGRCEGNIAYQFVPGTVSPDYRCGAPIDIGNFHYDHIDPDWYSKDNELSNCQVLCTACHKAKTAGDGADIAKSKRIRDKRIKALVSKRPMPGSRRSKFKKKMDGTVVDRRTGRLV